jgi:hypothetical protein
MDGNIGSDVEIQDHGTAFNTENRDFEEGLEAIGASNHHRLLGFAR